MMDSIKLFGQVILLDGEDHGHGEHKIPVASNYGIEAEKTSCKALKKPDKILPCPRCNSMDTKFCYFNNYNVNQPRHFCRKCQRYWTAGGMMRNVPVGAGRRKSKGCSSSKHITLSEATLRAVELACQEPTHRSLTFLNNNEEFQIHTRKQASSSSEAKEKMVHHDPMNNACQVHALQVPSLSGYSWLYQWNPAAALVNSSYPAGFHLVSPYWGAAVPSPPSALSSVSLGKHPRDGDTWNNSEKLDAPLADESKTMRIDDPEEVAKSSMWTTVGSKRDKAGGMTKGGLFRALYPKEGKKESSDAQELAAILSANPAALARSHHYQESV